MNRVSRSRPPGIKAVERHHLNCCGFHCVGFIVNRVPVIYDSERSPL